MVVQSPLIFCRQVGQLCFLEVEESPDLTIQNSPVGWQINQMAVTYCTVEYLYGLVRKDLNSNLKVISFTLV